MKYTFSIIFFLLLTVCTQSLADPPSTKSVLKVDSVAVQGAIYEGQTIDWEVSLINADPVQPDIENSGDFQLVSLGDHSQNSTNIIIINGRKIDNSQKRHIYNFQLTPTKTGNLTLPKLIFNTEGQQVVAGGDKLIVKSVDSQDFVIMKILVQSNGKDIGNQPLYPMQNFDIVLRIWIKSIPYPHSDQNPLTVQGKNPPRLKIPWAVDNLPDGLSTQSDVSVWLGPYQNNTGGFSINDFQKPVSAFDFMDMDFGFESRVRKSFYTFMPTPKIVSLPDASGKETTYYQFDFIRRFKASKTGTYNFGPVNFHGSLCVEIQNNQLEGETFFANAKTLSVKVAPPPEEGRPDDYINAVGLFDMTSSATPDKVRVGDPITLTVTVRGSGSFEDMTAPKLESIPEISNNFKIYEASDKLSDGQMTFTWSMRPLNDKVREIPAITASFFNVESSQYFQMKTSPIPLTVEKGVALLMSSPEIPGSDSNALDQNWKTSQGGVHANITNLNQLRQSRFNLINSSQPFIIANSSIIGIFIALAILIFLIRIRHLNPTQARRRNAAANARSALRHINKSDSPAEQLDNIVKVITNYVADRQNVPAAGLTTDDVVRLLQHDGVDDQNALNQLRSILEIADTARFGACNVDLATLNKAEEIITGIIVNERIYG